MYVQPSFNTRSSGVITLSWPLTSSILKIQIVHFAMHTLFLELKLPLLFRQPHFPDRSPPSSRCSVDVISCCFTFTYLIINYSFTLSYKTQNLLVSQIISALICSCTHRTHFTDFWTCIIGFTFLASLLIFCFGHVWQTINWLLVSCWA